MQNIYQWPLPHAIYPDRHNKSYRLKRFRYQLRSLLHRSKIKKFEEFVNQNPHLIEVLNTYPNYSYPVAHRFLDKRFNATERLNSMCENLTFLPNKLSELGHRPLWEEEINFGEVIADFDLRLKINEFQPMEGYWNLELYHKPSEQLIYLLTFGEIKQGLLIGVIQGPNQEGSKEIVKQLTKKCHGLRPAYLMVDAMKLFTQVLGYPSLFGIPQKYQNKSRFVRSKRFIVDYDAIFRESNGVLNDYWELPLNVESKNLEDIPSKKRSMYRKRYAMLQQLQLSMKEKLTLS
ncbi:DUF535 family protein [Pasteurella atlantica]|uniref:DUF535 family protein n=3 Tax=Pasteurellaceae TaxID=712 RepID=A0AAQ4LVX1_9PAST|nr:DUF535 family protein [Pasteurella atlantica]MBR0572681.1 DUF535 family protein [Pasteurella atlantica]MDP8033576.1 DUF535 family protein [Pasteurella atlantica]MDP8035644.1 DUF535 family protein [Pasteurella atlantica]MDP8037595.1 DUF535 family protein [Pasteurella atlantica]MDP8038626.1 DUF535 family protein [Pasteurella atlantica]